MGLWEIYDAVDAQVSPFIFSFLNRWCAFPPFPAPALRGLPLLSSPTLPLLLVATYLLISVLGSALIRALNLKPRDKEPTVLYAYVLLHNLFLFCLSAYLTVSIPLEAIRLRYSVWGNPYNPKEATMAWLIYLFYISKYVEFGDTLIMLLRLSVRQVSFLHVYHHATISLIWWCICRHAPGGDGWFSAMINSGVHVAMYGYYFLAALIGRDPKLRNKYLFWGRYLTQVQMLQFVLMLLQAIFLLTRTPPPYPTCLSQLLLVYMCTLLALFGHFYITKYLSSKNQSPGSSQSVSSKRKLA